MTATRRRAARGLPRAAVVLLSSLLVVSGCGPEAQPAPEAPFERVDSKLLLFGVDGATWTVIDPLLAQGRLPHLARLIAAGTRAPLATLTPTISPPIWNTIATGVLPPVHGIQSFVVELPGTHERTLPSSQLRRVQAIWNILSDHGYRVGVANWWASFPAEDVNGFVISDRANFVRKRTYQSVLGLTEPTLLVHEPGETHPEELYAEIRGFIDSASEIDPQRIARFATLSDAQMAELQAEPVYQRGRPLSVLKFTILQDGSSSESALYALRKYQPDFMAFYTSGVDAMEHYFWKYMEPEPFRDVPAQDVAAFGDVIENYYVYVDEILGRFLDAYDGTPLTVVIVSDHGQSADLANGTPEAQGTSVYSSGNHHHAEPGILVLSGPGIAPGSALPAASVRDIAPTVLALMGVPVGADMAGHALVDAFRPEFLARRPVQTVPTYTPQPREGPSLAVRSPGDRGMIERLKALGYVE